MQQKNTPPFMVCKKNKRCGHFYLAVLIALCCSLTLLGSSCKKLKLLSGDQSTLEQYFADNVLGRTFVVDFASDSSADITSQYAGYDFILTKTTSFYEGDMTGTKDGITYTGTWSSNSDYSKLVINLNSSNIPASFAFLNRSWKFTKKGVPVLELAPWGSTDPKVLHMRRL
jgi:hypothetical protein